LSYPLDGSKWSASLPDTFTSDEIAHGTRFIDGWEGTKNVMRAAEENIFAPLARKITLLPIQ
jgi:hypothetical protein